MGCQGGALLEKTSFWNMICHCHRGTGEAEPYPEKMWVDKDTRIRDVKRETRRFWNRAMRGNLPFLLR